MGLGNKYISNSGSEINAGINDYFAGKIIDIQGEQEDDFLAEEENFISFNDQFTRDLVKDFPFLEKFMEENDILYADLWDFKGGNLEGKIILDDGGYYGHKYAIVDEEGNINILPYLEIHNQILNHNIKKEPENKQDCGEIRYLLHISDDAQRLDRKVSIVDINDIPNIELNISDIRGKVSETLN